MQNQNKSNTETQFKKVSMHWVSIKDITLKELLRFLKLLGPLNYPVQHEKTAEHMY